MRQRNAAAAESIKVAITKVAGSAGETWTNTGPTNRCCSRVVLRLPRYRMRPLRSKGKLLKKAVFERPAVYAAQHPQPPFSISLAQLYPGAPMTPPPGCAPDPHKNRPRIGVRYRAQPATGRITNI